MCSVLILFYFFSVFAAFGAGRFVPRQDNGMLVTADRRALSATHAHDSSLTVGNVVDVAGKLVGTVEDGATVTASSPSLPTTPSTDATSIAALDFGYMMSPIYAWGNSLLRMIFTADRPVLGAIVALVVGSCLIKYGQWLGILPDLRAGMSKHGEEHGPSGTLSRDG
ncbi:hypothetical protein K488DRAFT_92209 [Vararia minispora EC-137]|uniref:Uncharacterized protein n=1 Tax=Vararia minispora EC-137 TaxID=1314806 RepID=A0ACB8Q4K8_9AGAM|nr:hypothetical protein K488DRAFT_92209 [Vararia minispora EC-137]